MRSRTGNILQEVTQGVILQQVNARGVMASGIAKQIREKWPTVWWTYESIVKPHSSDLGRKHLGTIQLVEVEDGLFVCSMVTQQFYGQDGERYTSYDALDIALKKLAMELKGLDIEIHHPLIGAGLGGGDWDIIKILIEKSLGDTTLWVLPDPGP